MNEYQLYIGGRYQAAQAGKFSESTNPTTGEVYATVHEADATDAGKALDNSWEAFQEWKRVGPSARESIFLKAANIVEEKSEELQDILIDEAGSTRFKAIYEVAQTAATMRGIAGECRRVMGQTYLSDYPGVSSYCIRRPLGVVLAISPFNFPLLLSNRKIGWALAAGNSVILKPSEVTPVVGLKLAEIYSEAGLPDGVLNVLPGGGAEFGNSLISDPRVKKVSFTGSSRVGKQIAGVCAQYNTRYILEMGGKNPLIVLNDADLDYAVNIAAFSNFMHQGQVCMTGSRVIVEAGIYDEFVSKFTAKVKGIKCGNPREPGVVVGPLIRPSQAEFIQGHVDAAVSEGGRLVTGGTYQGCFYQPTVIADVTSNMSIFRAECFGPVASVIKADDHEHALALANDSEYGLSAAVITNDLQKTMLMIEGLESGMVHINGPTIRDEPVVPFGGTKDSGSGREGGQFAMDEFTELKWITIQQGKQPLPF
jgi:vanillin dehydrogenase